MPDPAELLLIKDQYELAFHCLSQGLAAEEAGRRPQALEHYTKGRRHLLDGLTVPTRGERQQGEAWDLARQLQLKMREVLGNVSSHLRDLEAGQQVADTRRILMEHPARLYPSLGGLAQAPGGSHLYPALVPCLPAQQPPLALQGTPAEHPPAYTPQPGQDHRSLGTGAAAAPNQSRELLLYVPFGVQLFLVPPDGQVSSLCHPGSLRITKVESQAMASPPGRPSALLQVNEWLYPLTADTPVLLANSGIYMFPDVAAETPGSYVGIVLSSELPVWNAEMFQDILSQLTDFRVQAAGDQSEVINLTEKVHLGSPSEENVLNTETAGEEIPKFPEWSEKMSQSILAGAAWLGKGLAKGGAATGKAIQKGGSKLRDNINPEDQPSEVSPSVTKGLQAAKQATEGAARVSRLIINGVSTAAGHMVDKLSPHVKKHGAKLIPESMKKSEDGRASKFDGAKLVVLSSVQGLSAVWNGLETGAKTVGKSVASETVTTVTHKYGNQAGQATDTAVQSVVNVGVAAYNFDHLGMQAFLKTTDTIGQKDQSADKPEKINSG